MAADWYAAGSMNRPDSIKIGDTVFVGPVCGQCCPACGDTESIFKETQTFPYTLNDALADHALGISPWWGLLFPRRRTRMRCGKCNCLFPRRWPGWARLLCWGVVIGAAAAGLVLVYPIRLRIWAWLNDWCGHNPMVALTLGGVLLTGMFTMFLVASYPSRRRS
jgi:hypothetical protein